MVRDICHFPNMIGKKSSVKREREINRRFNVVLTDPERTVSLRGILKDTEMQGKLPSSSFWRVMNKTLMIGINCDADFFFCSARGESEINCQFCAALLAQSVSVIGSFTEWQQHVVFIGAFYFLQDFVKYYRIDELLDSVV